MGHSSALISSCARMFVGFVHTERLHDGRLQNAMWAPGAPGGSDGCPAHQEHLEIHHGPSCCGTNVMPGDRDVTQAGLMTSVQGSCTSATSCHPRCTMGVHSWSMHRSREHSLCKMAPQKGINSQLWCRKWKKNKEKNSAGVSGHIP